MMPANFLILTPAAAYTGVRMREKALRCPHFVPILSRTENASRDGNRVPHVVL
jgi:hypothetical protein